MKSLEKRKLSYIIIVVLAVVVSWVIPLKMQDITFNIEYDRNMQSSTQIFYDVGSGCSEENSVVEEINDRNVELSISVKTFKNIQLIRLDPVFEKQDDFKIESLRVDYGGSKI